mmetsp:Transcript_31136/g.76281  ORF Transcript_31136/g.76281 Transcript_31136/m.76281 type:complete len:246 (-) Transcript_31136:1762-2499(-)
MAATRYGRTPGSTGCLPKSRRRRLARTAKEPRLWRHPCGGNEAAKLSETKTKARRQGSSNREVDDQCARRQRRALSRLGTDHRKGNSVIHPDPDHHAEQKDKQQLSCNFEQDDKTANALATAWPGALAHTMVRGVRRWIGKVASKWPLKGKSLLLAVTKVCPRDPWAFVELGTVYVRIGDDRTAIEYFAMAAERGSAVGMLCLGDMLVQGKGGRRDHSLGQQLISKSLAVLGDGTGQSGIAPADV